MPLTSINSIEIPKQLFQLLKRLSRLKWEQNPCQGLKPSECELLGMLYLNHLDGNEAVTASDLSSQLKITPGGVTHLTNPLEEAGCIIRRQDPSDRRVVLIGLTGEGKALAESLISEAHDRLAGLVSFLGEEDSQTLTRLMSSMIEHFESLPSS